MSSTDGNQISTPNKIETLLTKERFINSSTYVVAGMLLVAIINIFVMRNCLSLTLTQMVQLNPNAALAGDANTCPMERRDPVAIPITSNNTESHLETVGSAIRSFTLHLIFRVTSKLMNNSFQSKSELFEWSEKQQGFILGAFFIGYLCFQIPNARLAERTSGKFVMVTVQVVTIAITFITPITVKLAGATGLIVLRILLGVFQAGFFAALTKIMSAWIPPKQRGKMGSLVFNGLPVSEIGDIGSVVWQVNQLCFGLSVKLHYWRIHCWTDCGHVWRLVDGVLLLRLGGHCYHCIICK